MVSKVCWILLGLLATQVIGIPVTDEDYPDRDRDPTLNEVEPTNQPCGASSGSLVKKLKCYAKGPMLSKDLLLPSKRNAVQVDTGPISCEEVTGYIMALHRTYSRRCANLADKCPPEYRYAISWFGRVSRDMSQKCDAETEHAEN
uniref:Putative conserved secreted protein n=1 Tax=Culex tarsalis TaxID=7177 RepID=A0A1Q3FTE0_CULTA